MARGNHTYDFQDKVCVITGAASGIGRALALDLASRGAVLALSDVDADGLAQTQTLFGGGHANHILVDTLDVSDGDAITAYAHHVQAALGPADYVFNVAGIARVGTFDAAPLSSFETIMNVNLYGVVRMSKAFLPQLKSTRGGLINISSIFGIIGFSGQTAYCTAKFGVRGFSETLAQELEGTGVRVSCVHPGGVKTQIARNAKVDAMPGDGRTREDMDASFDVAAITSAEDAAAIILRGTAKGQKRIIVGKDAKLVQLIARLFPTRYPAVLRRLKPDAFEAL